VVSIVLKLCVYPNYSSKIYVKDARKIPRHLYQNQLPILTKFPIANLNSNCKNYEFNKFTLALVQANDVVKRTKQF
jgi:hypothetical protein